MKHPLTPEAFQSLVQPSADVMDRLGAYLELLNRWQRRINLVGRGSLADPWRRHILDSAQLIPLLPPGSPDVVDFGSGAGFPGLVLAIMCPARVALVEADTRKCAFLAEAARVAATSVQIVNQRIESLDPAIADVITARACAPLPKLLGLSQRILRQNGVCLFLKGQTARAELTEAKKTWNIVASCLPSQSDASGVIIRLDEFTPRDDC